MRDEKDNEKKFFIVSFLTNILKNLRIRDARDKVAHARKVLENFKIELQARQNELLTLKLNLENLVKENKTETMKLEKLKQEYRDLKKTQATINIVRDGLTQCTSLLFDMFGKTKILRDKAKDILAHYLEPLILTVENISKHLKTRYSINSFGSNKKLIVKRLDRLSQKVTARYLIDEL